jgi:PIN domain nuclease of toxin-antitoxin system
VTGYLLDTHTALWWWTDLPKLGSAARDILGATQEPIFVSSAAALEIGIKWRLGKLPNLGDPNDNYAPLMKRNGFGELAISARHAMLAGTLPGAHRDPFDRIIAAQALIEELTVITRDKEIAEFGCKVLW